MTVFEAILIGLVQGLTEFLPVSSSGHILLCEKILGVENELGFTLMLHLATLLAVVIAMRKDIASLFKKPKSALPLLVATACSAIVVFALKGVLDFALDGRFLTVCFPITALMLLACGLRKPKKQTVGYFDAAIIGIVQGIAVLPGISRSGSTVSTAILLGNDKQQATTFSFLLSVPIIVGSALVDVISEGLSAVPFWPLVAGFASAFCGGMLALKVMFRLTKSYDFFAVYLCLLTAFLLANDFWLHLF